MFTFHNWHDDLYDGDEADDGDGDGDEGDDGDGDGDDGDDSRDAKIYLNSTDENLDPQIFSTKMC